MEDNHTQPIQLTKAALNKFIQWSTSRYNNYLGFGNKKDNVDLIYKSLIAGHYTSRSSREDKSDVSKKIFTLECAQGVGENGSGRHWDTKQSGGKYTIDCTQMTIKNEYSGAVLQFLPFEGAPPLEKVRITPNLASLVSKMRGGYKLRYQGRHRWLLYHDSEPEKLPVSDATSSAAIKSGLIEFIRAESEGGQHYYQLTELGRTFALTLKTLPVIK
jgi:hypothetical protein